eukprot:COSAG01_NODE_33142_length_569_cov_1.557447_1_plen_103_part_10
MSAAAGIVTPEKLQQFFVMCTTQDEFPANVMWMKHKALMCKSVRNRYLATRVDRRLVDEMAENKVLTSLDEHRSLLMARLYGCVGSKIAASADSGTLTGTLIS